MFEALAAVAFGFAIYSWALTDFLWQRIWKAEKEIERLRDTEILCAKCGGYICENHEEAGNG